MGKYDVKFSCGHTETVQLFGKISERERRIAWWEECGVCDRCYREQKELANSVGCEEVEMLYKDYKTNYSACKTKAGSYNGKTKTIIVYVPR